VVTNGSFEELDDQGRPTAWFVQGASLSSVPLAEGSRAARLVATGTGTAQLSQPLGSLAGRTVEATVLVSSTVLFRLTPWLELRSTTPTGEVRFAHDQSAAQGEWVQLRLTPRVLPANESATTVVIRFVDLQPNDEVWVDAVVVLASDPPSPTTTPSPTATTAPSPTVTLTPSGTASPTATRSPSASPTATASRTVTVPPGSTATRTPRPATATPTATPTMPSPRVPTPASRGDLLISELLADPAEAIDPRGEWVELFNPQDHGWSLAGCLLADNSDETPLPPGASVPAGGFLVVAAGEAPAGLAADAQVVLLPRLGNGLANRGDRVVLRCGENVIDALSWGSDTSFTTLPAASAGHSLARLDLTAGAPPRYAINRAPSPGWGRIVSAGPISLPLVLLRATEPSGAGR
jgi:hypothetical protein